MVRRGLPADVRFLRDMLHHAYYWRERMAGSVTARYVRGWGRRGDAAVIALENGFPVGAAWYRLFTEREPGYGFVDEQTPELAIAVVPGARGKGFGDELLVALCRRARAEGHQALSLSVDPANPSLKLYEKHGFEKVAETDDGSWTMISRLASTQESTEGVTDGS
jgi:L-amino acid N-acyltransferase YncA